MKKPLQVAPSPPDSTVYDKNNLLTPSSKLHQEEGTEAGPVRVQPLDFGFRAQPLKEPPSVLSLGCEDPLLNGQGARL